MNYFLDNNILASVTFASSLDSIAAYHEFEQRNINIVSPKGYYYIPKAGDKILLSSIQNPLALGCLNQSNINIAPGEIIIKNDSGAKIKLCNNGDIEINSLKINKDGKIINL
ncbi:MAG: hypothetical protein J6C55_01885 [Oscillospiraceae bacterium]|nr:hypothetical protein [Oscillospiraceae bacterium]